MYAGSHTSRRPSLTRTGDAASAADTARNVVKCVLAERMISAVPMMVRERSATQRRFLSIGEPGELVCAEGDAHETMVPILRGAVERESAVPEK